MTNALGELAPSTEEEPIPPTLPSGRFALRMTAEESTIIRYALLLFQKYSVTEEEEECDDVRRKDREYAQEELMDACREFVTIRKEQKENVVCGRCGQARCYVPVVTLDDIIEEY